MGNAKITCIQETWSNESGSDVLKLRLKKSSADLMVASCKELHFNSVGRGKGIFTIYDTESNLRQM